MLNSKRDVSFYPLLLLVVDWLLIAFAIFGLTVNSITVNFLSFILILRQQLALSVLMHEGVHCSLAQNKKLNDLIGIFFCSGPILSHFSAYRNLHMKHHRHALSQEDPGQYLLSSQNKKKELFLDLLKDISGFTYLTLGKKATLGKLTLSAIALNLAGRVFGLFLVWILFNTFGLSSFQFLCFWVLPLVTLHQGILRIRALMEHGGFSYSKDAALCTRSVQPSLLTAVLAPHNVNFHIEHHLYPAIPSYQLKKISTQLNLPAENNYLSVGHFLFISRFKT